VFSVFFQMSSLVSYESLAPFPSSIDSLNCLSLLGSLLLSLSLVFFSFCSLRSPSLWSPSSCPSGSTEQLVALEPGSFRRGFLSVDAASALTLGDGPDVESNRMELKKKEYTTPTRGDGAFLCSQAQAQFFSTLLSGSCVPDKRWLSHGMTGWMGGCAEVDSAISYFC
jgi:hypothetical protein